MKKKLRFTDFFKSVLIIAIFSFSQIGLGQTTLVNFKFENNLTPQVGSIGSPTLTNSTAVSYFGGVTGQSVAYGASTNKYFDLTISTTGYDNIKISFSGRSSQNGSSWEVSGDSSGGTTFTAITSLSCPNGSFGSLSPTLIGANYSNKSSIKIRIKAIGTSATLRLDDLILTGTVSNSAPTATSVSVSGTTEIGQTLTGSYIYNDIESDPEGTSIFNWYRADDNSGTNQVVISGATSSTYTLTINELNKYVRFSVTPVASTGNITGTETFSAYAGAVTSSNNLLSTITANNSFTPSSNINYASYLGNDVTNTSIEIARFNVNDIPDSSNDGLSTILTSIDFNIVNATNLNKIAIYDDENNELQEVDATTITSFSGLNIEALSGSTKVFSVRATFKTTVTDNAQLQLTVASANADPSGSFFATSNAGGATSSTNGDENRIEVTATNLTFNQDPSNVAINVVMNPFPTILAVDGELNVDLDYTGSVTLSVLGSSFESSATTTLSAVNGLVTFSNLIFDTSANGVTIEGTATGLTTTGNSASFDVTIPPAGELLLDENFDYVGNLISNGFSAHSGSTPNISTVDGNGLSYLNYASSGIGNAAVLNVSSQDVNKTFTQQEFGSTVYCSFLINVTSGPSSGDYFLHLGPSTIGSAFRGRVFVRDNGSNISFGVSNDGGNVDYTAYDYNLNETYLIVLKYSFDDSNTTSSIYINPSVYSEPNSADATDTDSASNTNIGSIALRQGSNTPTARIDEIRIGTGWGAVLGNPVYNTDATINTGTYNNVTLLNNTLQTNGMVKLYNTLSINGGTLTTNNNLTLVSTAANTAQVTEVLGSITGDVTVERYIPSKRAWRALTAPLKGSNGSLYTTWQNGGTTLSDTGLEIWGPTGTNIVTGPNYSVLDYTPTGWVGVTNTSTSNLFETTKNNAYLVFVTGAYGTNNITNGLSAATTLKATGTLITGDVNYTSIIDTRHTLIGNPYASPLEPSLLVDGATDLISSFWVWDPSLATTGGYVSYDDILNTYSNNTGSYPTNTTAIQSGQAFFVKATTGNTGSLTLSENKKATSVSNVFGKTENTTLENSVNASIFRVGLLKVSNQDLKPLDGAVVGFYDTANDAVDNSDGKKFANGGENIAFVRNNIALSSEHYSPAQPQDELFIRIWNTSVNSYVLRINTEAFDATNLEATLIDLFTGTQTPIALDGTVQEYAFAVTSSANSTGDRFKVVFGSTALGTTTLESSEVKVYPNPVTTGVLHIQLPQGNYTNYSYELINVLGQKVQSNEVESQVGNQFTISTKGLSSNWYILRLLSNGQSVYETKVIITN